MSIETEITTQTGEKFLLLSPKVNSRALLCTRCAFWGDKEYACTAATKEIVELCLGTDKIFIKS